MHPIPQILLCFVMAFSMVYAIMPVLIRIAHNKRLFDEPGARSSHVKPIPSLGGIAIFFGLLFATIISSPSTIFGPLQFIIGGLLIIFMTGAKDDIEPLSPRNKTMGLLLACSVFVFLGDVRLDNMYGLLGFSGSFPYWWSCLVSIFTIFVITNAFNLIDGINGLAASLGSLIALAFGVWFYVSGQPHLAILAFGLTGGLLAFLRYNITPAQIFMGDSGSLLVGAVSGILAVKFIGMCSSGEVITEVCFEQPVAVAIAFLIVPLFDTIRVFATRIYRGRSPFQPDRRHIHHLLIDSGRTHTEATTILVMVNIFFISIVFALDSYLGLHTLLTGQIGLALLMTYVLHRKVHRKKRRKLKEQAF